MEKAIFVTKISHLKYIDASFTRLYYGNEFCERLIPSGQELRKALRFAKKRKLDFSFVTPYVTNAGLGKLQKLFKLINAFGKGSEIIINDWGTLSLTLEKYPKLTPVLGRLLTKQKRGPNLQNLLARNIAPRLIEDPRNPKIRHIVLKKKLPLDLDYYYKGSNVTSVSIIHDFLINRHIHRVELDNTVQGIFLDLPRDAISASVYLPYIYITTTFFCPTAGCEQKDKSLLKIKPCKRECQRYVFKLRHNTMPKVIYLKGNTQFYKNDSFQLDEWKGAGVNRIVFEPEIPI
jgi:hypothetical protein